MSRIRCKKLTDLQSRRRTPVTTSTETPSTSRSGGQRQPPLPAVLDRVETHIRPLPVTASVNTTTSTQSHRLYSQQHTYAPPAVGRVLPYNRRPTTTSTVTSTTWSRTRPLMNQREIQILDRILPYSRPPVTTRSATTTTSSTTTQNQPSLRHKQRDAHLNLIQILNQLSDTTRTETRNAPAVVTTTASTRQKRSYTRRQPQTSTSTTRNSASSSSTSSSARTRQRQQTSSHSESLPLFNQPVEGTSRARVKLPQSLRQHRHQTFQPSQLFIPTPESSNRGSILLPQNHRQRRQQSATSEHSEVFILPQGTSITGSRQRRQQATSILGYSEPIVVDDYNPSETLTLPRSHRQRQEVPLEHFQYFNRSHESNGTTPSSYRQRWEQATTSNLDHFQYFNQLPRISSEVTITLAQNHHYQRQQPSYFNLPQYFNQPPQAASGESIPLSSDLHQQQMSSLRRQFENRGHFYNQPEISAVDEPLDLRVRRDEPDSSRNVFDNLNANIYLNQHSNNYYQQQPQDLTIDRRSYKFQPGTSSAPYLKPNNNLYQQEPQDRTIDSLHLFDRRSETLSVDLPSIYNEEYHLQQPQRSTSIERNATPSLNWPPESPCVNVTPPLQQDPFERFRLQPQTPPPLEPLPLWTEHTSDPTSQMFHLAQPAARPSFQAHVPLVTQSAYPPADELAATSARNQAAHSMLLLHEQLPHSINIESPRPEPRPQPQPRQKKRVYRRPSRVISEASEELAARPAPAEDQNNLIERNDNNLYMFPPYLDHHLLPFYLPILAKQQADVYKTMAIDLATKENIKLPALPPPASPRSLEWPSHLFAPRSSNRPTCNCTGFFNPDCNCCARCPHL